MCRKVPLSKVMILVYVDGMVLIEVSLVFLSLSSTVSRVVCQFFKCTSFPDDVEGLGNRNFVLSKVAVQKIVLGEFT